MKIGLITFRFDRQGGGSVNAVRNLADYLVSEGNEVVVITTSADSGIRMKEVDGIKVITFRPFNLYWIGEKQHQFTAKKALFQLLDFWNLHSYITVRRILKEIQADVVHVHKLRGLSPSVWQAASGLCPIVTTCHDYELMSPEGTLTGRVGNLFERDTWWVHSYPRLRAGFSQAVDFATAPSNYTLQMLIRRGFFAKGVYQVVPNTHGLTLEELTKRQATTQFSGKNKDSLDILFIGRLEQTKGIGTLCTAFSNIAATFPEIYLHIAGYGSMEDDLRRRYANHPQIFFHGSVFGEQKSALIQSVDLVVVPSTWPEVFGIVVIEAFAAGKPVLASNVGGIPELIEEGRTGFLVPPADCNALANQLAELARTPTILSDMSDQCFEAARQYTMERVNKQYFDIYQHFRGGQQRNAQ